MVMMTSQISDQNGAVKDKEFEENQRMWGEERHDDVIYRVMLRRIRRTGTPSELVDGLQWETLKVKQIKYATLDRLVSQLCLSCVEDPNFLTVFLATYRSFATPELLLEKISEQIDRLKNESPEKRTPAIRLIQRVLISWIEKYFNEDFYSPPTHSLIKRAIALAEENNLNDVTDNDVTNTSLENRECEFATYLKTKLKAAEVKEAQEQMIQKMNSPSHYSDILEETEDITLDDEDNSFNYTSSITFLNDLTSSQVAKQLTLKASILFSRVVPHHCLKAVRSSKEKPACVKSNIDQFNMVVYCVWGTCLCPSLKTPQRAKIFQKWIEVAQECCELKNFSSLCAILSTLQTHVIHRLTKTWAAVPKQTIELLGELKELNTKELLKPGTAKTVLDTSSLSKVYRDALTRQKRTTYAETMHGTVPYLGSFLTDLTYLHTAMPDKHETGLINFEKRRKEFDFLAQLQLWQASARCYQNIESDQKFQSWFSSVTLPTNEKALTLSEEIEAPAPIPVSPSNPLTPIKRTISDMFHHNGGLESSGSSSSSLPINHTRNPSNDGSEASSTKSCGDRLRLELPCNENKCDERFINIRVIRKDGNNDDIESKVMELSQNDRVQTVIKQVFQLFEIEGEEVQNFSLVQIISNEKELVMPESSNVFYAMVASQNLSKQYQFALLEKGAEIPKEKSPEPPANNLQKQKKRHKKSKSLSVSTSNVSSPMRSLFGNIALGSLTMASGSYSLAKQENCLEHGRHDSVESSEKSASFDTVSVATSNDLSDQEHDDDSGNYNLFKSLRKTQSHSTFDTEHRPRSHPISGRSPSSIRKFSIRTSYPNSEQSSEEEEPFSKSMDSRFKQQNPVRRSHNVSTSSDFFTRKKAIRKHHSHPKQSKSSYRKMSEDEIKAESVKQSINLQRQDSRSTFYVEIGSNERSSAPSLHKLNVESTIPENSAEIKRRVYSTSRALSEPDLLDREISENESVFSGGASPIRPRIILQCPSLSVQETSPQKSRVGSVSSYGSDLFSGTETLDAGGAQKKTSNDKDEITIL